MRATETTTDKRNGAQGALAFQQPYIARVTVVGTVDLLFHRWSVDSVAEKAAAPKNSKAKKTDDLESYVYRLDPVNGGPGELAIPGEYFRQAIIHAAKYRQDPRSPRKSAMDLYKAGVMALTILAPLGTAQWDYEDKRRALVQRQGITRTRPAMKAGWTVTVEFLVNLPEYISSADLHEVLVNAGRLVGVADNRPTNGRFRVTAFETATLS